INNGQSKSKKIKSMVDNIDLKIISILEQHARMSYAEIGREVKLSSSAVRERIQKIEDLGIIEKYTIQLNHKLLGYGLQAVVLVKAHEGKLSLLFKEVQNYSEVQEALNIMGEYNVHLKVIVKDLDELQSFLNQLIVYGATTTFITNKIDFQDSL
ncbi:MAG TPA: ArsR family transcriptional regulator, partial [Tenacibaculum sp.]|nr:ArsR family transcriptional regulator [Tenacibaculum sp.]